MQHHLGVADGAGGEINQQRVIAAGRLNAVQHRRRIVDQPLIRPPAAAFRAAGRLGLRHRNEMLERRAAAGGLRHLVRVFAVGDRHNGLGAVDPILDVAGGEQGSGRHRQRPQLHQPHHRHVPLRDPRQHQKHPVALTHAQPAHGVGELVGQNFQVPKGVMRGPPAAGVDRQQGQLGAILSPLVDHIETEIEKFRRLVAVVAAGVFVIGHIGGGIRHPDTSFPPKSGYAAGRRGNAAHPNIR